MNIRKAQEDMRLSYNGGGTGVFASGLVWFISGLISFFISSQSSILIFFFGGMLIHPIGILFSKLLKRTGKHQQDNPLAKVALESTAVLFIGLFIAYSVFQIKQEWFFPIMLMIIGVRYLVFQSIYDMKQYWTLGLILICSGIICLLSNPSFNIGALIGGAVELIFAFVIVSSENSRMKLKNEHYI